MIEIIIKRDGREEPFNAIKVNGWGQWAAKSLGNRVDWPSVVMRAVSTLPQKCTSFELQYALIKECLNRNSWSYNKMAGRLYAPLMHKEMYGEKIPTIAEVHDNLVKHGYMVPLNYSDEEYSTIEAFIKHSRDFSYAHFQHYHIRYKYSLRDKVGDSEFESSQFVMMRMAMALAEDQPVARRLIDVKKFYDKFSKNIINAPTPNYTNLGTKLNGYASCCLYSVGDSADSLAVGDHIAYMMTVMSAGIGSIISTRSIGDPVRGGLFPHRGKLPYYRTLQAAVQANIKNGRNGACTTYFSAFDPEITTLQALKNPMTPVDKQIRGIDYGLIYNRFIGRKAARKENVFLFNTFTAPDLYEALFSGDPDLFEHLYKKYEEDPKFKKTYVTAREILVNNRNESFETGRAYVFNADEVNRHTPSKDPIRSSNLCVEITEPTEPYYDMRDLYSESSVGYIQFTDQDGKKHTMQAPDLIYRANGKYDAAQNLKVGETIITENGEITVKSIEKVKRESEVALCSLAALVITNIHSEDEYQEAMYYALLMIDKCIHKSDYVLPHVGYTAKARMSAGVGIMDLAHHMARKHLKYSSAEGKAEIHKVAERHMYHAVKASLRLGKELGNAPWIHRTKWIDGWMPIDTYNKNIDKIVPNELQYDWEELRQEVIANKGIRNSFLVAHMPGESSSKASGVCNSVYQIRMTSLMKTDDGITTYWCAPDSDRLAEHYELSYNTSMTDQIEYYGILQKFTDQSISADLYRRLEGDEKVTTDEMLESFFHMLRMGMKTQYYMNVKTSKPVVLRKESAPDQEHKPIVQEQSLNKSEEVPVENIRQTQDVGSSNDRVQDLFGTVSGFNGTSSVIEEMLKVTDDTRVAYVETENTAGMEAGCAGGFCSL